MSNNITSTEKALKILLAFTPQNNEMGTVELSKKLSIHKSTVSRLLHLLSRNDFLYQNPDTKKYILGRSAARIGNAVFKTTNNDIVGIAQPYMNQLCEKIGESLALEVLFGTTIFLAHQVECQNHIRFSFKPGEKIPVHVSAGSKAMLAFCDPDFVKICLKNKFERYTENTIVSKKEYLALLEEVRKTHIAYDKGERYDDVYAMATPVFDFSGAPVAAVIIAGPAFRMTDSFLKNAEKPLMETAETISRRLFFNGG